MTIAQLEKLGLIRLKEWVVDRAIEAEVSMGAIYMRLHRGRYPNIRYHRINKRVIYIEEIHE
jgi:hypothetical protein